MKKFIFTTSFVCTLFLAPCLIAEDLPVEQTSFTPFAGRVTGKKVRLRSQPNLEGPVLKETKFGEVLEIRGELDGFYIVAPPADSIGFVFRTFVLDGVVEGNRINIRLFPDLDAPIIGKLNQGTRIDAHVCETNNKWLEIQLPESSQFFIAKEYIENLGPVEMVAQLQAKSHEAHHRLSAAFHVAQAEIVKPFPQIDREKIEQTLQLVALDFPDLPDIVTKAHEVLSIMQDTYLHKKICFLDATSPEGNNCFQDKYIERLKELGFSLAPYSLKVIPHEVSPNAIAQASQEVMGLATAQKTDKMLVWQPLEEALYHLWVAANGPKTIEEYYNEEKNNATFLTGIIEAYEQPVKNCPGDFLLKNDKVPIAFLYSTCVDLQKLVGKKVMIRAAARPNNQFAFPAYFVLAVE